ncbi:MAG: response regulator [Pseudomonadota bacterium]
MTQAETFTIREERYGKEHAADNEVWLSQRPTRVLVAEDDDEMRKLITSSLRKDGYEVWEARNGMEFLSYLSAFDTTISHYTRKEPPDLIVTDVRMPGLSGLEVLEGLRQMNWAVPVVLITAFGDEATHAEAERLGVVAIFDKPFDLYEFRGAILKGMPPY